MLSLSLSLEYALQYNSKRKKVYSDFAPILSHFVGIPLFINVSVMRVAMRAAMGATFAPIYHKFSLA